MHFAEKIERKKFNKNEPSISHSSSSVSLILHHRAVPLSHHWHPSTPSHSLSDIFSVQYRQSISDGTDEDDEEEEEEVIVMTELRMARKWRKGEGDEEYEKKTEPLKHESAATVQNLQVSPFSFSFSQNRQFLSASHSSWLYRLQA